MGYWGINELLGNITLDQHFSTCAIYFLMTPVNIQIGFILKVHYRYFSLATWTLYFLVFVTKSAKLKRDFLGFAVYPRIGDQCEDWAVVLFAHRFHRNGLTLFGFTR